MPVFPALKSGSTMQYPATRTVRFRTHICRFLDGSEQRFRKTAGPARLWTTAMQFLDSSEAAALMDAFLVSQGRYGTATFTDPWDGSAATAVRLDRDELTVTQTGEERFNAQLTLAEERE